MRRQHIRWKSSAEKHTTYTYPRPSALGGGLHFRNLVHSLIIGPKPGEGQLKLSRLVVRRRGEGYARLWLAGRRLHKELKRLLRFLCLQSAVVVCIEMFKQYFGVEPVEFTNFESFPISFVASMRLKQGEDCILGVRSCDAFRVLTQSLSLLICGKGVEAWLEVEAWRGGRVARLEV